MHLVFIPALKCPSTPEVSPHIPSLNPISSPFPYLIPTPQSNHKIYSIPASPLSSNHL